MDKLEVGTIRYRWNLTTTPASNNCSLVAYSYSINNIDIIAAVKWTVELELKILIALFFSFFLKVGTY